MVFIRLKISSFLVHFDNQGLSSTMNHSESSMTHICDSICRHGSLHLFAGVISFIFRVDFDKLRIHK